MLFSQKSTSWPKKAQFLCIFALLCAFLAPERLRSRVLEFSTCAFFVKTAIFLAPKCPCHCEKTEGRNNTKKAQETKKAQKGGSGFGLFFPIFIPGPISGPIWFPISGRRPETYFLAESQGKTHRAILGGKNVL